MSRTLYAHLHSENSDSASSVHDSRYRTVIHLVVDSGLVLAADKILEVTFLLMSKEPDLTGRTNETYRIFNQMSPLLSVGPCSYFNILLDRWSTY